MMDYFADTFYYLAILNPTDAAHQRATSLGSQLGGRVVTTAWVVQEVADGLAQPPSRGSVLKFLTYLQNDPLTTMIEAQPSLWREGLELYCSRQDKSWSLTDCISFVVMQQRGIKEALTGDRHFEQAGFIALLKSPR